MWPRTPRGSRSPVAWAATPCTLQRACPENGEHQVACLGPHRALRCPRPGPARRSSRLTRPRHVKVSIAFIPSPKWYKSRTRLAASAAVTRVPAAARARAAARDVLRTAARPSARRAVLPARPPTAAARIRVVAHLAGAAGVAGCVGAKPANGHLASAGGSREHGESDDRQRGDAARAVLAARPGCSWVRSRHGKPSHACFTTRGNSSGVLPLSCRSERSTRASPGWCRSWPRRVKECRRSTSPNRSSC